MFNNCRNNNDNTHLVERDRVPHVKPYFLFTMTSLDKWHFDIRN